MKKTGCLLSSLALAVGAAGCHSPQQAANGGKTTIYEEEFFEENRTISAAPIHQPVTAAETSEPKGNGMISVNITAGGSTFSASFVDSEATRALVADFPMTIPMSEMNGQEKYYYLPEDLPADSTGRPATIHSGDILCWSGNCLVLFYTTFSNSYGGYVPLGTVDDPSGLAAALGPGDAEVTWELAEPLPPV